MVFHCALGGRRETDADRRRRVRGGRDQRRSVRVVALRASKDRAFTLPIVNPLAVPPVAPVSGPGRVALGTHLVSIIQSDLIAVQQRQLIAVFGRVAGKAPECAPAMGLFSQVGGRTAGVGWFWSAMLDDSSYTGSRPCRPVASAPRKPAPPMEWPPVPRRSWLAGRRSAAGPAPMTTVLRLNAYLNPAYRHPLHNAGPETPAYSLFQEGGGNAGPKKMSIFYYVNLC